MVRFSVPADAAAAAGAFTSSKICCGAPQPGQNVEPRGTAAPQRAHGAVMVSAANVSYYTAAPEKIPLRIPRMPISSYIHVTRAGMAELADATDSKSVGAQAPCGFDSHSRHASIVTGIIALRVRRH